MLPRRTSCALFHITKRYLSTSVCRCVRNSRIPWDKRFPVFAEDVAPDKKGGSQEMMEALPEKSESASSF